jgi:SAM-dependent methyltransferase
MANVTSVRTRQFFDGYARDFDSIYSTRKTVLSRVINRTLRKSMALRYQKTLEGCRPVEGKRVLDLGCGPGHYSIALARAGATQVLGIDFAQGMIDLARHQAAAAGVTSRCTFWAQDFFAYQPEAPFDYVVVMGVMDYIAEPQRLIRQVLSIARERAFFSFPVAGTVLAWQRRVRYRRRCPLFMYTRHQLDTLLAALPDAHHATIEPIARDFFVTISKRPMTAPVDDNRPQRA